jgi:hypothetical protein
MWAAVVAMAILTVTRRIRWFWIPFGAGLAIYFLQSFLRKRAKKSAA